MSSDKMSYDMGTLNDLGNATYLFPPAGYLTGVASLLDISGTMVIFNVSPSPEIADSRAIAQDWYCVGDALRSALAQVETSLQG